MSPNLESYLATINQQPVCEDSWLTECLPRARAGDDDARRRILGSCLRLAWRCVEGETHLEAVDLFDLLQEANAGLVEGLEAFQGQSAIELEQCLQQHIRRRMTLWLSEQGTHP